MATVISSPAVHKGGNRALPTEASDDQFTHLGNAGETRLENKNHRQTQMPEIGLLEQVTAERDSALRQAQQAEDKLAGLQTDLAQLKNQAKEQGFREGVEQARDQIKAEQDENLNAVKTLLDNLAKEKAQLILQAEDAAIEIAFAATTKLLGKIKTDQKMLESLVKESTRQVLEREGLVVYLAASDCQRMQQVARSQSREWSNIEFRVDDQLQWGGCRVESHAGSLDARLELQIDALKAALVHTHRTTGTRR